MEAGNLDALVQSLIANPVLSPISALARTFVKQRVVLQEDGDEVHEMWTNALMGCPWLRGRDLHEDFTEHLAVVAERGRVGEMFGALNLCHLRWSFYHYLDGCGLNMKHVNAYEIETSQMWFGRIYTRLNATRLAKVKYHRVWPARLPVKSPLPIWVN